MKLIGMLDSPYVRRVAISLQLLGLRFEHQSLSVFRDFERFRQINPLVKAPTLVTDDADVLLDSTLILQYAEALARPRTLMPSALPELRHDLRVIGLALAACDKAVQLFYERTLRPPETVHPPWEDRIAGQLLAAYDALEAEIARRPLAATRDAMRQAGVSSAVSWQFAQRMHAETVPAARFPCLAAFSVQAEALPEFRAAPFGGTLQREGGEPQPSSSIS